MKRIGSSTASRYIRLHRVGSYQRDTRTFIHGVFSKLFILIMIESELECRSSMFHASFNRPASMRGKGIMSIQASNPCSSSLNFRA